MRLEGKGEKEEGGAVQVDDGARVVGEDIVE